MSLTRAQRVRLGAFVVAGIAVLLATVVALTGTQIFRHRDRYTVYFSESVSGLEPGAAVRYRGLRVGRVEEMRIAPEMPDKVEVRLGLDPGVPLFAGVRAQLDQNGLTGLKNLNLVGGDVRGALVPPGSELPSAASFLDRLTGQAEQLAIKLELVLNRLALWADDDNRKRFQGLMEALERFASSSALFLDETRQPTARALQATTAIAEHVDELSGALHKSLVVLTKEAQQTMTAWRRPVERLDPQALPQLARASANAMRTFDERLSDANAGAVLREMRDTIARLHRVVGDAELTLRAGREDFISALSYLRQAAEDIREFSRTIAQDPSVLVRGQEVGE